MKKLAVSPVVFHCLDFVAIWSDDQIYISQMFWSLSTLPKNALEPEMVEQVSCINEGILLLTLLDSAQGQGGLPGAPTMSLVGGNFPTPVT